MTRWLQAAQRATDLGTKPTEPTKPAPRAIEGGADTTEKEVLSVSSVLSVGGKPVAQIMPEGNVHDVANTILQALRVEPDGNQAAIDACLAPYRDAIAMVAEQAPVRKIHIDNLVKHKMRWRGF